MLAQILRTGCLLVILTAMTAAYAESAPVYDADALERQFQSSLEQPDLPPPPAPGQENEPRDRQRPPQMVDYSHMSMEERMHRVEQQMNNMQSNDATQHANILQKEVQSLRAQVEQLSHQLQLLQSQQKKLVLDVDDRFKQIPAASPQNPAVNVAVTTSGNTDATSPQIPVVQTKTVVKATTKPATVPQEEVKRDLSLANQPNVAEEQLIYQTAYNLIKAKKYAKAAESLQSMLKKYPTGQFASNAHYWLGELYGLLGQNDQALKEFLSLVKSYPQSPRLPDAQLKIGIIYASQFNWKDARASFKQVINKYPGTVSSKLANEQLKQIKLAGH